MTSNINVFTKPLRGKSMMTTVKLAGIEWTVLSLDYSSIILHHELDDANVALRFCAFEDSTASGASPAAVEAEILTAAANATLASTD